MPLMGKRGPKPKPQALKELEGSRHAAAQPGQGFDLAAASVNRPAILGEEAGAIWDRVAPPLAEAGLLTTADVETLASYCQSFARWLEAERKVDELGMVVKTPKDVLQLNPYVNASKTYLAQVNKAATELGLTPAARARLVATITGAAATAARNAPEEKDMMDVLLTEVETDG